MIVYDVPFVHVEFGARARHTMEPARLHCRRQGAERQASAPKPGALKKTRQQADNGLTGAPIEARGRRRDRGLGQRAFRFGRIAA